MKKRKSIHDLAKELKISAATISYILNGKARQKRVSIALEERVLKYISETGYKPSMAAKTLRTGKSMILGVLVEDISDPFFAQISRTIEAEAYKLGYKIFVFSTENDTKKAKELIHILRDRQVDGYIIAPPPGIEKEIRDLLDDGIPVVLFDRYFQTIETENILIDNIEGAYNAMLHLINNGHRKIGFITLESEQTQMVDRLRGYNKATCEHGLAPLVKTVPYNLSFEQISSQIKSFLNTNKDLDAIFFSTNYLTFGGLMAIKENGLKIPDDIAIVSFDDSFLFDLFTHSITAVAQPISQIAATALEHLVDSLKKAQSNKLTRTTVLKTRLIVRLSCKKIEKPIANKKEKKPLVISALTH